MDPIAEWTEAQSRVVELVSSLSPEQTETPVPACPAWTVRQLLSHVVGLDADVLAGDEPDDHNSAWTQRQVDARAEDDIPTIVAEWQAMTGPMQSWMREHGTRPLGDVVIHEQDLRAALNRPGGRDSAGVAALRDRMADRFRDRVAEDGRTVRLIGETWSLEVSEVGADTVTVRASDYDLFRALVSRRSESQLRQWTETGEIGPLLPAFSGLGPLPEHDLVE